MKRIATIFLVSLTATVFGQTEQKKNPSDFLPEGYVIFEEIYGDLNKDGLEDCVMIIKGTDKSKIVQDEYRDRGELDQNRRGVVILFNKKDHYKLAVNNYDCFSSENEDGGGYFPPELFIEIYNENMYIHYGHGRYGYWSYTFRYQNSDFELIGYDRSNNYGAIVNNTTSINFLTKKKHTKEIINEYSVQEPGDEVYKETWVNIQIGALLKLSEIKDLDEIRIPSLDY